MKNINKKIEVHCKTELLLYFSHTDKTIYKILDKKYINYQIKLFH